ncbi:MAG: LLM class flavin-dependent oxidoreductase [Vulcanimicrobiota bacterium]
MSDVSYGLFFIPFLSQPLSLPEVYDELVVQARTAQAEGWQAVWLSEHHGGEFGDPIPSPAVVGAWLAAQTRTLRIGAAVVVLPLHDGLRVAEDFTTLDRHSPGAGRAGLGPGLHSLRVRLLWRGL